LLSDHRRSHSFVHLGQRQCSRRRAFTIIEVVFGATVMVMAITTSITTMQRAFLAVDCARKVTLAGQIMQSELEKMRLEDWTVINAYPATSDITSSISSTFGGSTAMIRTFTLSRAVSEVHADMKLIILTASWKSYDGRAHYRSYTTYYGKNGLYDYFYNSY
jgi:hypothetical protein